MSTCSVKLWYNKQRIKKSGYVSLYIQIIVKRESLEIPLKIEWPVASIDTVQRELMPRYVNDPDFLSFQTMVEQERSKYWNVIRHFLLQDFDFTITDIIKEARVFRVNQGIAKYIKDRGKQRVRKKDIKESTYNAQKGTADWVEAYTNGDIDLLKINCLWLEKFHTWLLDRMGEGGAWARIKDVKAYLNIARKKDRLPVDRDFENFTNTKPESDPVWLDTDEVIKLMQFYLDPQTSEFDKGPVMAFLYACFTGLRISDLKRWNVGWIEGNEMIFQPKKKRLTDKRKNIIRIPIIPLVRNFIDNLEGNTFELPSEQKYNKRLKKIAKLTGINKTLTTHVARHTFGTQLAVAGVPLLVISKLMGHKKPETTMVYIHIAEQAKARAMMKLQDTFGNYGLPELNQSAMIGQIA